MVKTVLFPAIQFRISTQFSSIWPINRTLSGATIPDQNIPGSDGNKGVLRIPLNSNITWISLSDCLVLYPGTPCESGVLPLCRDAVGVFYSPNWIGNPKEESWLYDYWLHLMINAPIRDL